MSMNLICRRKTFRSLGNPPDLMQKNADKHAFEEMVHSKDLNVPPEVLADPRTMVISGPNVPNKPWLRKPRLNPIAEDFFQTTPDYSKSVYETYGGITLRLAKNSHRLSDSSR